VSIFLNSYHIDIIGTNDSHNSPCSEVEAEAPPHSATAIWPRMWRSFAGSHLDTSISIRDTPRHVTGASWHSKSAAYGRTRDGRRNYQHFVTAYDIHFIVNNKYYAMKIQEKSESFPEIPEIPWIRSNYLDVRIFRYPISTRISTISTNIYSPPKFSRIWHTKHWAF